tara:strand:- start:4681 stop:4983 length:303 start_codon:yes stop_codon:yes gene_type:complete
MKRVSRKAMSKSNEELTTDIEALNNGLLSLHQGLQVVLAELNLVSTLLLNDLKERGKIRQADCVNCGQTNNIPLVAGMEVDELICRFCNNDLETKVGEEE